MKCPEVFCYCTLPCKKHGSVIDIWHIDSLFFQHRGSFFYCVSSGKRDGYWLMKMKNVISEKFVEINIVKEICTKPIRNRVEVPLSTFYDVWDGKEWYVMRHYSHVCKKKYEITNINALARACLMFACDLHHETKYAYIDWRLDNIFKDSEGNYFIGDYEFCEIPNKYDDTFLIQYGREKDMKFYFIQRGAELDKALVRYRFDLEAIGYMLMALLWTDEPYWYTYCDISRKNPPETLKDADLIQQRNEYKDSIEVLRPYFQKIKECSWEYDEPNSREWYKSLLKLFP